MGSFGFYFSDLPFVWNGTNPRAQLGPDGEIQFMLFDLEMRDAGTGEVLETGSAKFTRS